MVYIQEIIYLRGAYIINLVLFKSIGTHFIPLYVNGENVTYFDNFGVEHIREEIRKFIRNKNTAKNIYKIQVNDSIMCLIFLYWIY